MNHPEDQGVTFQETSIVPPGDAGTFAAPILVPSQHESRFVGYEDPDSHMIRWYVLTLSLTHSLTHSFHLITTGSFNHTLPFNHSHTHTCAHAPDTHSHTWTYCLIQFTYSLTHSLTHCIGSSLPPAIPTTCPISACTSSCSTWSPSTKSLTVSIATLSVIAL